MYTIIEKKKSPELLLLFNFFKDTSFSILFNMQIS